MWKPINISWNWNHEGVLQQEEIFELKTIENIRELAWNVIVGDVKDDKVLEVTNSGPNFLGDGIVAEWNCSDGIVDACNFRPITGRGWGIPRLEWGGIASCCLTSSRIGRSSSRFWEITWKGKERTRRRNRAGNGILANKKGGLGIVVTLSSSPASLWGHWGGRKMAGKKMETNGSISKSGGLLEFILLNFTNWPVYWD